MNLKEAITARLGAVQVVKELSTSVGPVELLRIPVQKRSKVELLMTCGLSNYKMPVLPKHEGREHVELYFCLPAYWDLDDVENPRMNWVMDWIQKLVLHVIEKETWYGTGHTIPAGNPPVELSEGMKQRYFFLCDPSFMQEELTSLELGDRKVHFLAILPIFDDEFDYKIGKGTYKLLQRLERQGVTELLDDFRGTVLRSKWRVFRR
ncbi:MAG: suppressor of fused domain protein [Bacteroidetes bacterium]|nr:MAG: suppressor of fused domain protein [Bacteroidota bacterium]